MAAGLLFEMLSETGRAAWARLDWGQPQLARRQSFTR